MTAHVMKGDKEQLIADGMDDYLAKPASKAQIASILEKWLHRPSLKNSDFKKPNYEGKQIETAIDRTILQNLAEDTSIELVPQLIQTFINNAEERLHEIQKAAAEENSSRIEHEAHSLKSSAATFGAFQLHQIASELETAGKSNDHEKAKQLTDDLAPRCEQALDALSEYISEIS